MKIRNFLLKIRRSKYMENILKILFKTMSILPQNNKTMIFESFLGKQFSDNPKAIYEYIKEKHPSYDLYWSMDRKYMINFQDKEIKYITRFSFKWFYTMGTAKYWIVNSRLPLWIPKPKNTIYLQTWHGTPLKKLGLDINEIHMPGTDTTSYKSNFTFEASKWDYLISPNNYSTKVFKDAFKFDKTIIESGYPRNDALYIKNNVVDINDLKKNMNIPSDKKVILYAPTWRDNDFYSKGKYRFQLQLDLEEIHKKFSEDYIILLRMHYLIANELDLNKYKGFAFDLSNYNEISELYLVSDVLITDYSSVFFDYANLWKPILFFTYDIDSYRDELRGFYFDFEKEAPGPLVKTTKEVIYYLDLIKEGKYQLPITFNEFYNKYCYLEDGNATKRVVNYILEEQKEEI